MGKIYFLLVRIKIKHMELEIRRRESTGSGPNTYNESETLAKYEIMDGAPVRGLLCLTFVFIRKRFNLVNHLISGHRYLQESLFQSGCS